LINNEDIFASDFIKPICLPTAEHLRDFNYEGINLDVAGWGQTENGNYFYRLVILILQNFVLSQRHLVILNSRSKFLLFRNKDATQYTVQVMLYWDLVNCVLVEKKVQILVEVNIKFLI